MAAVWNVVHALATVPSYTAILKAGVNWRRFGSYVLASSSTDYGAHYSSPTIRRRLVLHLGAHLGLLLAGLPLDHSTCDKCWGSSLATRA